jgi:prepilin-type N-terminal cleavage/methylation domain-containing protein
MCRLPNDLMKNLMPKSHEHSTFNERGMSLIELLVGVAIASVVLTACYGSYVVVTGYYRTQSDISHVRQTLRQTLEILGRDIQRAGFVYLETAGSQITEPLRTTNGVGTADTLNLVFDKCTQAGSRMAAICNDPSQFTRMLVLYEVKQCPINSPIQRTTRLCRTTYTCPTGSCGEADASNSAWVRTGNGSPIADHVEDLQFALKTAESTPLPAGNGASAQNIDIGLILATKREHGNPRQLTLPGNWKTNFQSSYQPPTDKHIRDWGITSVLLRNNAYSQN